MTVNEAARLRGFRRSYVLNPVRWGRLGAEVPFGQVLVRRHDVEGFERAGSWRVQTTR